MANVSVLNAQKIIHLILFQRNALDQAALMALNTKMALVSRFNVQLTSFSVTENAQESLVLKDSKWKAISAKRALPAVLMVIS